MTFGLRVFIDDDHHPVFVGDYPFLGVAIAKADTLVRMAIDDPDMSADSFSRGCVVVLDLDSGDLVYQASTRVFRA